MYFTLLRVFFKQQFSIQRLFGSSVAQSVWKRWLFIGLLVYAMAVSIGGNLYLYLEIAEGLQMIGQLNQLLLILFANVSSVAIFLTLFQATGYLFAYKDFETLAPLPIPHWQVIAAKFTMMQWFIMLFSLLFNGPIMGVYLYFAQASWVTAMLLLLLYVLIPIPVVAIVSLMSWLMHQIASRFVHKHVMQIILMLVFILGYIAISLSSLSEDLVRFFEPFTSFLNAYYQPAVWFTQSVAEWNGLSLLLFIGFHLSILALFLWVMTPLSRYANVHQFNVLSSARTKHSQDYKPKSFFWSMFIKEWRYYVSIPIYFINTAFGLMMLILGSLGFWLFKDALLTSLGIATLPFDAILLMFFGFTISTVYTPAISLSLEGSNFSLLKSLPVQGLTIMVSKVLFNISLVMVPLLISLIILSFASLVTLDVLVMIGINAVLFTVLTSFVNGLLNVAFPKFEFQNEVEVVKQSLGAFFGVFSGFGIMALLGSIATLFSISNGFLFLLILALFQGILSIGIIWIYPIYMPKAFAKLY